MSLILGDATGERGVSYIQQESVSSRYTLCHHCHWYVASLTVASLLHFSSFCRLMRHACLSVAYKLTINNTQFFL